MNEGHLLRNGSGVKLSKIPEVVRGRHKTSCGLISKQFESRMNEVPAFSSSAPCKEADS